MRCPNCGTLNGPTAQFCSHCGTSLTGTVRMEGIAARVEPSAVAIAAGGQAEVTVSIRNDKHVVEHVELAVDVPTAAWAKVAPPTLRMMPGTTSVAVVKLVPPKSSTVAAGPHALRITVKRSGSGEVLAYGDARVEVGPFYELSAQVIPRDGAGWFASRRRVWLNNTGNDDVTIRLQGSDPDDVLRFAGVDGPLMLPPEANMSRAIRVRSRTPNMHLRRKRREFAVTASWDERQQVVASGVLVQRGLILVIVLVLLALLIVVKATS
jgi:hypothetical protein